LITEEAIMTERRTFPIFKTVTLGQYENSEEYRQALKSAVVRMGDFSHQMLKKISVARTRIELDLVIVSVGDLGLYQATCRDIYPRALELGLELCPAEVGPALRLAYVDQSFGEILLIAMEPITVSDGSLWVFRVEHADAELDGDYRPFLWLVCRAGDPDHLWVRGVQWVFVQPRRQS
jgi:hypothetical protein